MKAKARSPVQNALVNIFVFPGLGSLRAGRRLVGIGQIVGVLAGSVLVFTWCYEELAQYYAQAFGEEKPQSVGWIGVLGGAVFLAAWLWSCITSISLFRAASQPAGAPPKFFPTDNVKVTEGRVAAVLTALPGWRRQGDVIARTFEFGDFPAAMRFVNAVADLAEQVQHHPDIDVRWNKVTLALTTHDAGGLTEKDFALAREFDVCAQVKEK
jgi:4a-hydroxytetrahydrobiopterin dehydratase